MYERKIVELYQKLGSSFVGSLATIDANSNPAVRTVSMLLIDGCIYFQTDSMMDKAREIQANNNVAVCIDGVQIKGYCKECGKVSEESVFEDRYKEIFPSAYEKYSHLENERVYKISPVWIKCWSYLDNQACYEIYDLTEKKYIVEYYQKGEK